MEIKRVHIAHFSPTGTTTRTVRAGAEGFGCSELSETDWADPKSRAAILKIGPDEQVIAGMPVYYGRIPSLFHEGLPLRGEGTPFVPVAVYGNRQFQSTVVGVAASTMTARALLERFTSAADDNFINYQNTDYDALFQQAQATADDAEQTELYKQMERNLTEHAANVYIQDLADLVVLRNGLEGYEINPIYVMDLSTVHYAQ